MEDDWFDDALTEGYRPDEDDEGECPICGDDIGASCPCLRD